MKTTKKLLFFIFVALTVHLSTYTFAYSGAGGVIINYGCEYYDTCTDPCIANPTLAQCTNIGFCDLHPQDPLCITTFCQLNPQDPLCQPIIPPPAACGNGTCSADERCNCPADCGAPDPEKCINTIQQLPGLTPACNTKTLKEPVNLSVSELCINSTEIHFLTSNSDTYTATCIRTEPGKNTQAIICKFPYTPLPPVTINPQNPVTPQNPQVIPENTTTITGGSSGGGSGQTEDTLYGIYGTVTGDVDVRLGGVEVKVFQYRTDGKYNIKNVVLGTVTRNDGSFNIEGLPPGHYVVLAKNTETYTFTSVGEAVIKNAKEKVLLNGLSKKKPDIIKSVDIITGDEYSDNTNNNTGDDTGDESIDWIKNLISSDSAIKIPGSEDKNILTSTPYDIKNNPITTLLKKGYTLEYHAPYVEPIKKKYAEGNAVCGNAKIETSEACDDGINNGKSGYCSADCLYSDESKSDLQSDIFGNGENYKSQSFLNRLLDWIKNHPFAFSAALVAGLITLMLGATQTMLHQHKWKSYTIQPGDTYESLSNKFNMTERALKNINNLKGKKGVLQIGQKISVRNREFIQKDYLEQLKTVLDDALRVTRKTKFGNKITQLFK